MAEEVTVVGHNKTPASGDLTVYVDGKIINRFESFSISHSMDVVPISFSLQYGLSEGVNDNMLIKKLKKTNSDKNGILPVGKKVRIYLEKELVITGYIDSTTEAYSHDSHTLSIEGRSKTSVLVDSSTDKPTGTLPTNLVTLYDIADYMFSCFKIKTEDLSGNKAPKHKLAEYAQIDLTTKPYDYVSMLSQFEGKLLYDDGRGYMIINDVASKASDTALTDKNSKFENIMVHRTTLGRYRKYRFVINSYGGPAGWGSLIDDVVSSDQNPDDLPFNKNITLVSTSGYPEDGNTDGYRMFTQDLANYTASVNWGRGQTVTALASGFIDPTTKKIWKINTLVHFNYKKPYIKGDYVVQSVTFFIDQFGGKKTELTFVKKESLIIEPVTLAPPIDGVNTKELAEAEQPPNAKENK
ncbi:hypothetical protein KBX73_14830 [Acetobacter persici]|uniref:phage baseplate assembly protein n=1 Tax=Acetobacter persici TaxID=1076596 RepID=UPI001BAD2503|nr:hypothetical protein [Acetobacter persici]MBS1017257.1 hypothetical protein [Acetobacter persici]MCP9321019.1 hypothetical protein [Acetobacter persici]